MLRRLALPIVILGCLAGTATAQPAATPPEAQAPASPTVPAPTPVGPVGVQITTLAAPDAFSTPGRDTGLPPTLWAGASLKTVRTVLPLLAARPLTPAGAALARRVLATGATGPAGAREEPALAAARANALLAQGDARAAAAVLAHAPGVDRSPELAQAVAEAALLAGDDATACRTAEQLSAGRDEAYWLRLRTYCQAIAGQTAQAQLTFDLAQAQAKDPVFARLMTAKLAAAGNPGPPSLRNGLDYALSKSLGLDLAAAAKPAPAVAAALAAAADPVEPTFDALASWPGLAEITQQVRSGQTVTYGAFMGAMNFAASNKTVGTARWQVITLLIAALDDETGIPILETWEQATVPEGKAPLGRNVALEIASRRHSIGEVALLALWTCAEAGGGGLTAGDRVRIVRALHGVGLERDARNFVLEGLQALK